MSPQRTELITGNAFRCSYQLDFKQANHDAYSHSGTQVWAENKDFSSDSQTGLTRNLISSVAQVKGDKNKS